MIVAKTGLFNPDEAPLSLHHLMPGFLVKPGEELGEALGGGGCEDWTGSGGGEVSEFSMLRVLSLEDETSFNLTPRNTQR